MCLLARAKWQQNLRRTGSVGRKVSEPYASKSKRQQNKRSRYNRTSGKLMQYRVKSNPILWRVEALQAWKVPKQLAVECPRCLSLQPGCCGAQPGPGLSLSPAPGCAGSVSGGCFPLVAAAWPLPGLGFPHGLCRDDNGFSRWCGLRVSLPDALLQLGASSVEALGLKITSHHFCPGVRHVLMVAGASCSTMCLCMGLLAAAGQRSLSFQHIPDGFHCLSCSRSLYFLFQVLRASLSGHGSKKHPSVNSGNAVF